MMTFSDFMGILNGEYKETAGTDAKNQCVDLANAYIKYVLGFPIIEWTNAVDFPSKADPVQYDWILNTLTNVPVEGDLMVWKGAIGHIAVFIEGNTLRFTSFDENYPTGSPCHVQEHSYLNVLGWLHPKNSAIITQPIAQPDPTMSFFPQDSITAIYKGILGVDPSADELAFRMKQVLVDDIPMWDVVSQVLHDDGRSPLKEAKSATISNSADSFTVGQLLTALINKIFFPIKKVGD